MIRIYWSIPSSIDGYNSTKNSIQHCEGGWWFAETIGSTRSAFRILDRIPIEPHDCIIEVLEPLADDFVETPCWLDSTKDWKTLTFQDCPQLILQEQVLQEQQQSRLLRLSFPLEQMSLALSQPMVLQHLGNLSTSLHETIHKIHLKSYSLPVLQEQSLKQHPQHLVQKEEPVVQRIHTRQASLGEKVSQKGVSAQHSSQLSIADPFFAEKKGIQTGALCLPMILPEKQAPRKTKHHRKGQQIPPHKMHHKEIVLTKCLINLRES